jgi:hypothetical protein
MNPLLLFMGGALIVVVLVFLRTVKRTAPAVTWQDIPSVLATLAAQPAQGHFAVFLFDADGMPAPPGDSLNVQVSIDAGVMGIDWLLIAKPNVDTQSRFREFFGGKGLPVISRESNGVEYLRVEGERIGELVQEFLREEFGVTSDQRMDLIAEGFTWSSYSSRT